jgi:hypothetical protein
MRNFKVAKTALEMIAAGHSVEMVMDVLNLEPDDLLEILDGAIEKKPGKAHVVEFVLQEIESEMLGDFDVCVN